MMGQKSPTPTSKTSSVLPPSNGRQKAGPKRGAADSQINRKRELDRIAQRMSRERSRNRILFLEEKLRSLEALDNGGQTSQLLKTIESLRTHNTELTSSLMKIRFIVDNVLESSSIVNPGRKNSGHNSLGTHSPSSQGSELAIRDSFQEETDPTEQPRKDPPGSNQVTATSIIQARSQANTALAPSCYMADEAKPVDELLFGSLPEYDIQMLAELAGFDANMTAWSQPTFDWDFTNPSQPLRVAPDAEKWHVSNEAFVSGLELSRTVPCVDPGLDSDTPVRAILWGWESVDQALRNHPVWTALRQIDERVFGNWTSKAQKLAMLYVCHLMMQYRTNPSRENLERVPVWFRPRPSQERIEHPLVIDFLIWPGLRDHLVFTHRNYTQSGEFSRRFCEDLRFHWPFPDEEIFVIHPVTQTYIFSERFRQHASDLKNWTMDAKFFETYQEMSGSIPASNERIAVHV